MTMTRTASGDWALLNSHGALKAAKQIACEQEQKRSQQSLKAAVGNHGYRDIGVSNQQREHCKKDRKDKSLAMVRSGS